MYTEELIIYLNQLKEFLKRKQVISAGLFYGGVPVTYTAEPIDEIIKRLKILEELKKKGE